MIKRITAALIGAAMIFTLAACGSSGDKKDGKVSIVCTIFPAYDWVKNITEGANGAEITYLLDNGADLHSYQPTAEDILTISDCDLFIYAGGESDKWVADALENKHNKDMKIINMLEAVGENAKEEEVKEGMQAEAEEHEEHEAGEEEKEYDEHTWLSVKNARKVCQAICDDLCEADKTNKESYQKNLDDYLKQLDELDNDFKKLADEATQKTLIFCDRFPFRYFTDDYGFDYYAAFVGCSAETEASFETIAFLAKKVDELGAGTVFVIENSDGELARSVIDNTEAKNAKTATLYSLQSVTKEQLDSEHTYITLMRQDLETLRAALC